jgi:hypothetical protein
LLTKVINKFINDKLLAQKSRHPHSLKHSNNAKEKIRIISETPKDSKEDLESEVPL